jgi:carbon-monoxide dehydrogenase medium subunit
MDIAVVGVGARITLDNQGICTAARVSLGAAAPTALLVPQAADALTGGPMEDQSLQAAGQACFEAARPIGDQRGPADYRRKIAAVLCRRVVATAADRAKERGK